MVHMPLHISLGQDGCAPTLRTCVHSRLTISTGPMPTASCGAPTRVALPLMSWRVEYCR